MQDSTPTPSGSPRPLRVAFIGTGNMAQLHLKALRKVETPHTVVAACDLNEVGARSFAALAEGCTAYTSAETMLAEAQPDLVHIVTPAGHHFEPARLCLEAGASVYVEKPFVETLGEAQALISLARSKGLVVCAGHQLIREHVFSELCERAEELRPLKLVDSEFQFFPPTLRMHRAGARAKVWQLLDILPHPLYSLIALLERYRTAEEPIVMDHLEASPTDILAHFRCGDLSGRLWVSLEARPVASTLTVRGKQGSATADLMRATRLGAPNDGSGPLEKILNPIVEGLEAQAKTVVSVGKRVLGGGDYPGLAEHLGDWYAAVAGEGPAPLSDEHLLATTEAYERIASVVRNQAEAVAPSLIGVADAAPLAVVTGARGFFGREIAKGLAERGFRVRGVSRSVDLDNPYVHEWAKADLGAEAPASLFEGADIVIHAAAETAGGREAHQRNSVDATRHVLEGMQAAGARRLIHVSSIVTLALPKDEREPQTESTPLSPHPEFLGPYTWGKTVSERIVIEEASSYGVTAKVVRPGAIIDWAQPEVPGLVGKRLFGRWHLGLGRPEDPFGIYDVEEAGELLAWMAERFDAAPAILNVNDDRYTTRAAVLDGLRARGWDGRMIWVPIRLLAVAYQGRAGRCPCSAAASPSGSTSGTSCARRTTTRPSCAPCGSRWRHRRRSRRSMTAKSARSRSRKSRRSTAEPAATPRRFPHRPGASRARGAGPRGDVLRARPIGGIASAAEAAVRGPERRRQRDVHAAGVQAGRAVAVEAGRGRRAERCIARASSCRLCVVPGVHVEAQDLGDRHPSGQRPAQSPQPCTHCRPRFRAS